MELGIDDAMDETPLADTGDLWTMTFIGLYKG
jgi:hypothetical protein